MRGVHIGFIICAAVVVIVTGCWGVLYSYANQKTIPDGVRFANWELGGLPITAVEGQWAQQQALWSKQTIDLQIPTPQSITQTVTWEQLGLKLDDSGLSVALTQLREGSLWSRVKSRYSMNTTWELKASWEQTKLQQRFNASWETAHLGDAVNAVRWINPQDEVRYIPDQPADRIDWSPTIEAITKLLPSAFVQEGSDHPLRVTFVMRQQPAPITLEKLQAEGIERKIVEFSTSFSTSGDGRTYNVTAAANVLNNTLLAPGDTFDYAKIIDATKEAYGFREAPVILQGRLVPGIGGGICQVSSTLYNAVIRTGLNIVERRNHSLPVSYLPLGQDATFAEGYINFRFQNTTGKALLIRTQIKDKKLTVKLFGTLDKETQYHIDSRTVQVLAPTLKYVINKQLAVGASEVLSTGKPGYVVETYQTKTKAGKLIDKKRISRDTYPAQPKLIAIHPEAGSTPPETAPNNQIVEPMIEDGITETTLAAAHS